MNTITKIILAALPLIAVACNDNIPAPGTVHNAKVEKVIFDETLSEPLEIIVGKTFSVPEHVSVLPDDATNTAQRYESSDPAVADVSEKGLLSALSVGDCSISVYAGAEGVYGDFQVKVLPVPDVLITNIVFMGLADEYRLLDGMTVTIDLKTKISVAPEDYSEKVVFTSSAEDVASVDENGVLTIKQQGEADITAAAAKHPEIKAVRHLKVSLLEEAEWDRSAWTMTCTQDPLPNTGGRNNSLTAMLDGKPIVSRTGKNDDAQTNGTAFCIDVPGRNSLSYLKTDEEKNSHEISFTIDMKEELPVNYLRISNISDNKSDVLVRYRGFTEISGSNDGENFTVIMQNLDFADKQAIKTSETPTYNRETEKIGIKFSQYRYLKFMMRGLSCYGPQGKTGGTAQIEEFYLGYSKDINVTE